MIIMRQIFLIIDGAIPLSVALTSSAAIDTFFHSNHWV